MCVTILLHNILRDFPIIIGNNRDELITREFSSPEFIYNNPMIFAPKDLEKGGTWIGINEYKIVINILNRYTDKKNFFGSSDHLSRGILVLELLKLDSVEKIIKKIEKINLTDYLPFHLLVADKNRAFLIIKKATEIDFYDISNRIFIIGNLDPFKNWDKYDYGYNFLKKHKFKNFEKTFEILKKLLKTHNGDKNIPSKDFAVKLGNFQTTSSSIIGINSEIIFDFLNGFPTEKSIYSRYKISFR